MKAIDARRRNLGDCGLAGLHHAGKEIASGVFSRLVVDTVVRIVLLPKLMAFLGADYVVV